MSVIKPSKLFMWHLGALYLNYLIKSTLNTTHCDEFIKAGLLRTTFFPVMPGIDKIIIILTDKTLNSM